MTSLENLPANRDIPEGLNEPFKTGYLFSGLAITALEIAMHDPLTGLLNKEAFKQKVGEHIDANQPFGLIFMDMDAFKAVNDKFGHEAGDRLLQRFGKHMSKNFRRSNDIIAHEQVLHTVEEKDRLSAAGRYGGDEFAVLVRLDGENDRREPLDPQELMKKELGHFNHVVEEFVDNEAPEIKATKFGIAVGSVICLPNSGLSVSELIAAADAEMYKNKALAR